MQPNRDRSEEWQEELLRNGGLSIQAQQQSKAWTDFIFVQILPTRL